VTHAFFYNGVMSDMNAFVSATDPLMQYVTLTDARGINDSRMIVVNGIDNRTQATHAYLLQGPWLDLAPANLSFAAQAVGTVSAAQSVSLKNSGPTALTFSVSTSGDFGQTSDCPSSLVLAPGASCTVMVSFAPAAAGDRSGALTVISGGASFAIPLSGIAPIKVSISSSAASTTVGTAVTLTWTASPGAVCTATGGSAADGWNGTLAVSGTQAVKETTGAGYVYGLTCTAGSQSGSAQVSVMVNWPAVTVSVSASPTTITAGQSTTLTWVSANATSCTATGGGPSDNWPGAKPTSGSASATEAFAPASASVALTFTLTCTSSVSGLSAAANAVVTENAPPSKSGGGAIDSWAVLFLSAIAAASRVRLSKQKRAALRNN
jgi:hypothetical protein